MTLNISQAAEASGLPVKTVRYYADIGLARPAGRSESGYRLYDAAAVERLIFLRRARAFGFSIEDCRELLGLFADKNRASADVKRLAEGRLAEMRRMLAELKALEGDLARLVSACHGDERPDCPILDRFAG